jgi:hypothetical protein
MPDDDITEPRALAPEVELDQVAALLRSLAHEAKKVEAHMRHLAAHVRAGRQVEVPVLAAHLRGVADLLTDRATRLHDAARHFEPIRKRTTPSGIKH